MRPSGSGFKRGFVLTRGHQMATAEQLNQAIALIQGNQHADAEPLQSDVERMTVGFDVLPATR